MPFVRIVLLATLVIVGLAAAIFVIKLVFGIAMLAFLAIAVAFAINFVRAFARRLATREAAGAAPVILRR